MDKLNILVLHRLGNPDLVPIFLRRHVFSLRNDCPEHNYIYHNAELPLPTYVQDLKFDAIILDVTFLCMRWAGAHLYNKIKSEYAFVADSDAVKIAFPQDEYDCSQILDDWMCEWKVDIVFSVISSNWNVLYPKYHKVGKILLGYTGYIDEKLIDFPRLPFEQRKIDIGYRARKLLPYFGRIGEEKWTIGEKVEKEAKEFHLKTDIVLGDSGTLLGNAWLDFINDSKFTLGSNSGSSLLDPYGKIQSEVKLYLKENPKANFHEVEEHCFKGLDGHYEFTAISPRVLEAGLLESCQILVNGEYSRIIQPWTHYIPIKNDASDFYEVYQAMKDRQLVDRLRQNCRSALLDFQDLRAQNKSKKVIELIKEYVSIKHVRSDSKIFDVARRKYEAEMPNAYKKLWRLNAIKNRLSQQLIKYPILFNFAKSLKTHLFKKK